MRKPDKEETVKGGIWNEEMLKNMIKHAIHVVLSRHCQQVADTLPYLTQNRQRNSCLPIHGPFVHM